MLWTYSILRKISLVLVVLGILVLSSSQPAHAKSPLPPKPWTVYLGFDDGPMYGRTDMILDVLKKYHIHATFFIQGNHAARGATLIQREIREGHHIGNHLWYHEDVIMAPSHPKNILLLDRFNKCQTAIHKALGETLWAQYTQQEPIIPFRWPGGAIQAFPLNTTLTYNWQVTAGDDVPDGATLNQVVKNVLYGDPPHYLYGVYAWGDGTVILLHDTSTATRDALPKIIENLLAHGAVFGVLPRPQDAPGTLPIRLGEVPPCSHQPGNCEKQNRFGQ